MCSCRSNSGLGLGDNIHNHTDKWLQVTLRGALHGTRASADAAQLVYPSGCSCSGSPWSSVPCRQVDEFYTGNKKPPMEYCEESEPIKCHGQVVASYGSAPPCPAPRRTSVAGLVQCTAWPARQAARLLCEGLLVEADLGMAHRHAGPDLPSDALHGCDGAVPGLTHTSADAPRVLAPVPGTASRGHCACQTCGLAACQLPVWISASTAAAQRSHCCSGTPHACTR